jgi:hypothetical protein
MNEYEIKDRIREQIKRGIRISLRPPIVPGRGAGGVMGMCSIPFHRCAAGDGDRPEFEFNPPDSKICLHEKCYRLWIELETKPN